MNTRLSTNSLLIIMHVAMLYQRYSGLRDLAEDIKRTYRPDVISDNKFQDLKHKWFILRDYLVANPTSSKADQADFVNDVLNGGSPPLSPKSKSKSKGKQRQSVSSFWPTFAVPSLVDNALVNWVIGSSSDASSGSNNNSRDVKDPDFIQQLRPLEISFPVLAEITKQVYTRLADTLVKLEGRIVEDRAERLVSSEQRHQNDLTKNIREAEFRGSSQQAFETLLQDLRSIMNNTAL